METKTGHVPDYQLHVFESITLLTWLMVNRIIPSKCFHRYWNDLSSITRVKKLSVSQYPSEDHKTHLAFYGISFASLL